MIQLKRVQFIVTGLLLTTKKSFLLIRLYTEDLPRPIKKKYAYDPIF